MRIFKSACATGVCFFLFSFMTSCSKSSTSTIRVDMSEAQSMVTTNKYLSHVIISVMSGEVPLARVVWENDDPAVLPPPYFELVVPPGPDRLIQYAEVWDDADTGEMNFLYGDVKRSLDSGDVTVEITVNPLVSTVTTEQRLKGRYLDAQGNSPTGPVQWFVVVPGGVPPIYVEDTFIYGGWMDFHLFDNVPVLYRMKANGSILYLSGNSSPYVTGNMLETQLGSASPPQNLLKITMPDQYWEGATGNCQLEDAKDSEQELYFGYFGPGGTDEVVYYSSYDGPWPFFGSSGCGVTEELTLADGVVSPVGGKIGVKGGHSLSSPCNSSTHLLCLDKNKFPSGSVRHALNEGPFRVEQSYSMDPGDSTMLLHWGIFPSAKVASLSGFLIFYKELPTGGSSDYENGDDDFLQRRGCEEYLLQNGFTKYGSVSASSPAASDSYAVYYTPAIDLDNNSTYEFGICPRYNLGGQLVAAPHFTRAHWEPVGP